MASLVILNFLVDMQQCRHADAGLPDADSLARLAHPSASVAALINVLRVSLSVETEELL
jgi:hypothetical protein